MTEPLVSDVLALCDLASALPGAERLIARIRSAIADMDAQERRQDGLTQMRMLNEDPGRVD